MCTVAAVNHFLTIAFLGLVLLAAIQLPAAHLRKAVSARMIFLLGIIIRLRKLCAMTTRAHSSDSSPPQSRWSHSPFLLSGGKLNHRADPRAPSSPLCPNVSSFYLLIRAGPCWTTVNIVDQEDLFYYPSDSRHMQARVLTHAHHYQSPTCDLS